MLNAQIRRLKSIVVLLDDATELHAHVVAAHKLACERPSAAAAQLALIGHDVRQLEWKALAAHELATELNKFHIAAAFPAQARSHQLVEACETLTQLFDELRAESRELQQKTLRLGSL